MLLLVCGAIGAHAYALEDSEANRSVKRSMEKWLAGFRAAYPSAASPYWRALPMRRMGKLIGGTFFTTVALGFTADLLQLNARSLGRGFFWPIFIGGPGASIFLARIKFPPLVLPPFVLIFTLRCLPRPHADH